MADLVAFAQQYEFEDVVADVTGADRVEAGGLELLEVARRAYKAVRLGTRWPRLARALAPAPVTVRLTRDYELFFPVFNHPYELYALTTIPSWRKRCRHAVCFVAELWLPQLPEYLLELLSEFDHVFMALSHPVDEVARVIGRPCSYLPLATDVLAFAPALEPPQRLIDVCNIGRRSPVTHRELLRLARQRSIFYYYDTVSASGADRKQRTFRVDSAREHRLLLASVLQRSRYFVANRARVNEPEFTRGRQEISGRFYEGASAGVVMLGDAPDSDSFRSQFDWPDAVLPLPFDSANVEQILCRLDLEPARLARIRRDNVRHSALRHDWVYRLGAVLHAVGVPPTRQMAEREARLRALAEQALTARVDEDLVVARRGEPLGRALAARAGEQPQYPLLAECSHRA